MRHEPPQDLGSEPRLAPLLACLFPPGVVVGELRGQASVTRLPAAEAELVRRAGLARRSEFAGGRLCARWALERLGYRGIPVLRGSAGEPLWPAGACGSVSHTEGWVAAAVCRTEVLPSLGLDLEVVGAVEPAIWPQIFTSSELRRLASVASGDQPVLATAIFAAKEALYKCQYPLTGEWLDFKDVEIETENGEIEIAVLRGDARIRAGFHVFEGRYIVDDRIVAASVTARHAARLNGPPSSTLGQYRPV